MTSYIKGDSIFIDDVDFPIDSDIEIFYFSDKIPFVLNVIDSKHLELKLLISGVYSVLFVKITDKTGNVLKIEAEKQKPLVSVTDDVNVLDFFRFFKNKIVPTPKKPLTFSLSIESFVDIFTFPDFSEDITFFTELDFASVTDIPYEFKKDFLYKITLTYEDKSGEYIFISEKPTFYFCNTEELKKFFSSDKFISNLYIIEEYPLLIWKKSLEIPGSCGFPFGIEIPLSALPLFSKYVIYACCVDLLFFLLNNTTSDNVEV